MQKLAFVDETFDLNFISEYHLSIQFSLDGLSFSILDGIQKKYVSLVHQPIISNTPELSVKHLKDIINAEDKLQVGYKSIQITYSTARGTLVPDQYSQNKYHQLIAEANFGENTNEEVTSIRLKPFPDSFLFEVPTSLKTLINDKFPEALITHETIPLLWNVLSGKTENSQLAILIRNTYFWLIYIENNRIKFLNSFAYQNDEDILYFLLNVVSQLGIDPEKTPLHSEGLISKKAGIYHRFRQYIKHVQLGEATTDFQYSYLFNQLPDLRFVPLLNLQACAL